ncbi:ExbD/TolR family protein [Halodurantibacterium flavum]|uniref:ExbD/TolR family protein n=1 Tax=Halodurantibacterium flavum TaxID=1382802 RepID=A0ABW4RZP2_9RHOB
MAGRLAPATPRNRAEPTIALINVVFLMLVFFLVAGQIARPTDRDMRLVEADLASARVPDDALLIRADGTTLWRGEETAPEDFAAAQPPGTGDDRVMRLLPDRDLPARDLIAIAGALRAAGATEVRLITERGLSE